MSSPPPSSCSSSGRKRTTSRQYSAEDQALNQIASEAETRLTARRAARAEARDIRIREIERQQKEQAEEEKDKQQNDGKNSHSAAAPRVYASTAWQQDSVDAPPSPTDDVRTIKKEMAELDDKYKKSMMNNAQLDNEKQTFRYQVDVLKDNIDELEEAHIELQREHKDRCRELEQKKRDIKDSHDEVEYMKQQLQQRDILIEQYGLVFINNDTVEEKGKKGKTKRKKKQENPGTAALVTPDAVKLLEKHDGNLDEMLKRFADEKQTLEEEVKQLTQKLEEEKAVSALEEKYSTPRTKVSPITNGPDVLEVQMEAQRQLNEYKFKLKKAEQDIMTLEGNVVRLESQVKRYRSSSENSEKNEEELKQEKRKLQRELRETTIQMEDLQTQNHHLQKRLEKMKSARNAIATTTLK